MMMASFHSFGNKAGKLLRKFKPGSFNGLASIFYSFILLGRLIFDQRIAKNH